MAKISVIVPDPWGVIGCGRFPLIEAARRSKWRPQAPPKARSRIPRTVVQWHTTAALGAPPKVTVVSLQGDGTPLPLDDSKYASKYAQGSPKFSPDGRWLAYCSNESGKAQVY